MAVENPTPDSKDEKPVVSQPEVDDTDPHANDENDVEDLPGMSQTEALDNVRKLLPVHAAPRVGGKSKGGTTLKVARGPGRPRNVERMPTTSDLEYHAEMSEAKQRFIDADPVVVAATKGNIEATRVLKLIQTEVAKEAAALHFARVESEKYGKDTSQTSTRRIDALTKIANIELEIRKLGPSSIDPHSEEFQRIFSMWVEAIRDVAAETLSPEQVDLFFNRLTTKLDGWEDRVAETSR